MDNQAILSNSVDTETAKPVDKPTLLQQLPKILRGIGAGALVVAMYSFLVQGWQSGNDVFRYLLMLGHTGALAAIGLASGHWLQESKSARLLTTLALISIPANFAILGALIYSQSGSLLVGDYPSYVAWTTDSLRTALVTTGFAFLVLIPTIFLGFSILARSVFRQLSILFLIVNAALLLPLRDPVWIGALATIIAVVNLYFCRVITQNDIVAKTREGAIALALQMLPVLVLLGRNMWLYAADELMLSVLAATIYLALRQASLYANHSRAIRNALDAASLIAALAFTFSFGVLVSDTPLIADGLVLPLAALAFSGLVYDISSRGPTAIAIYRYIAVLGLVTPTLGNMLLLGGLLTSCATMALGVMLILQGYRKRQRCVFLGGALLVAAGLGYQALEIFRHFSLGSWATLAILGIALIVCAAMIESQGGKYRLNIENWKNNIKAWDY